MELVPYLLRLLEGQGLENLGSPAATKAQIVKALKSMTRSLQYGEQVSGLGQDLSDESLLCAWSLASKKIALFPLIYHSFFSIVGE